MRAPEDLHPDDAAMRLMLRDLLVYYRNRATLSQRALAGRMGQTQGAIGQIEHADSWRVSTLQRWARGVDARLLLRPLGLPETDLAVQAFRPADPVRADAWDLAEVREVLVTARRFLGVTQVALGEVLECSDRAVAAVELGETDVLLGTVQRYCRALGGALWVGLGPA